jgi:hypothetical protein
MATFNERVQKLSFLDWKLSGWASLFFGLALADFFPRLLVYPAWFYLGLAVVLAIRPVYGFWAAR